ncbi:MAG: aminodeoxychorismate lyase [Clostridiales bacterium]|nr:aminodeoxychorismate lyase [Clostridiales bacterium]
MNLNKVVFKFVSISSSILVALLVIVGLVRIGSYCYEFGYRVFTEQPVDAAPGRDVVVQVTGTMSEREISTMLADEGLVDDGLLFFAQLKLSAYSGDLRPGIYTLNTSMTAHEMMALMASESQEEAGEIP